jgi:hypothetical protein
MHVRRGFRCNPLHQLRESTSRAFLTIQFQFPVLHFACAEKDRISFGRRWDKMRAPPTFILCLFRGVDRAWGRRRRKPKRQCVRRGIGVSSRKWEISHLGQNARRIFITSRNSLILHSDRPYRRAAGGACFKRNSAEQTGVWAMHLCDLTSGRVSLSPNPGRRCSVQTPVHQSF